MNLSGVFWHSVLHMCTLQVRLIASFVNLTTAPLLIPPEHLHVTAFNYVIVYHVTCIFNVDNRKKHGLKCSGVNVYV